jgi:NAD(P)-dependent dehydrogenase (short-subunit alcohol dehydrogenase family)
LLSGIHQERDDAGPMWPDRQKRRRVRRSALDRKLAAQRALRDRRKRPQAFADNVGSVNMPPIPRRKVLITGAAGGMGRACARLFGTTDDLILTDVVTEPLEKFASELRADAYNVVAHAGNLSDDETLAALIGELGEGQPLAVVHTAGLSPSLAGWKAILEVNLVATEKLLRALETVLTPGSVAIVIASQSGHLMPALPDVDAVLVNPFDPGFFDKMEGIIKAMGGEASPGGMAAIGYALSKRAVQTICQDRGIAWGPRGARIVSISPGLILTPMGRSELAHTSGAQLLLDATPVGRGGMPMDIALAAQFLASDAASFISGTDLLVDGAGTAAMKRMMAGST